MVVREGRRWGRKKGRRVCTGKIIDRWVDGEVGKSLCGGKIRVGEWRKRSVERRYGEK